MEELINNFHNFLNVLIIIIGKNRDTTEIEDENDKNYYKKFGLLLEYYIKCFDNIHTVNEIYNIIDYKCFYNEELNHNFDINIEYNFYLKNQKLNNIETNDNFINNNNEFNINTFKRDIHNLNFTLLSYTWLFDAGIKYEIINLYNTHYQKDIMLSTINNNLPEIEELLYNNSQNSNAFNINDLFFNIRVRRDHLIEDTLNEISKQEIKKFRFPLKVEFIGEDGVDEGGLKKEFFMLLTHEIFNFQNNMFTYNTKTNLFTFNYFSNEQIIKYELIGIIFGLAIYNSTIINVKFPKAIYKKLLNIEPNFNDIEECDPELYKNLLFLYETQEKCLEEKLDMNFTALINKNGKKIEIPLIENGENIKINNENKNKYVDLYIDWYLNKSINEYFTKFKEGFYKVFDEDLTKILTEDELELILCGNEIIDLEDLKQNCKYTDGYNCESETIKYFWEILFEFSDENKKKFLMFVTGCDRTPINGMRTVKFIITKNGDDIQKLPSAHTCFNNLILPDYKNKEILKEKLIISINYSQGFGFS